MLKPDLVHLVSAGYTAFLQTPPYTRFGYNSPLTGQRHVTVTERRTAVDFAQVIRDLLEVRYPHVETVILVMDNLNTHQPAALYAAFEPALARAPRPSGDSHTPKHGSWLNMAEIELSVLSRQCLDRRIPDTENLTHEVAAWEQAHNADPRPVNWRFTPPMLASSSSASIHQFKTGEALAHNVQSEEEVDEVINQAIAAGATLVKKPQKVFWGGYSGYFKDLDGHLWEVAHNPHFWIGPRDVA